MRIDVAIPALTEGGRVQSVAGVYFVWHCGGRDKQYIYIYVNITVDCYAME